jgi:hypothetical protein
MAERNESFWGQVWQVVLAICALVGACVIIVALYALLKPALPAIGRVFWPIAGFCLAVSLILAFVFIGLGMPHPRSIRPSKTSEVATG